MRSYNLNEIKEFYKIISRGTAIVVPFFENFKDIVNGNILIDNIEYFVIDAQQPRGGLVGLKYRTDEEYEKRDIWLLIKDDEFKLINKLKGK
jgi:hypothetical protein